MINSRQKGQRGERAFRDVLREAGYCARRGAQYSGHVEAPDVICSDLPDIHFEVKNVQSGNPYKWVEQAIRDCKRIKFAVVAHKRNDKPWLAILEMRDLLEIIRRSDLPRVSQGKIPELPPTTQVDDYLDRVEQWLDAMGVPHDGKGKISIPVKR